MSDEKDLFSLTELAEDAGISWRNYLSKAIRKGRDIYAKLKGFETLDVHSSRLTLNSLEEMNEFRTPDGYVFPENVKIKEHYRAWADIWLLPKSYHYQLLRDMPLWEIRRVTPTWVLIENSEGKFKEKEINKRDRNAYTSYIEPVLIDENHLFLFKSTDEKDKIEVKDERVKSLRATGRRKPHTAFAEHAKKVMKIERGEAWQGLIDFADASKGQTEVHVPGYGKIYLRRVRLKPEKIILYSHEPFDYDKADNLPDGVKKFTIDQFQTSWTDFKKKSHEGSMKEV